MSSRRLVFTCAIVVAALGTGVWHTVNAFPLMAAQPQSIRQIAPGPVERQAKPITPENPIPRRTNYEAPGYPMEARAAGASGSVTLMVTLDELGRVVEARRVQMSVTSKTPAASIRFSNTNHADERMLVIKQNPDQSNVLLSVMSAMDDAAVHAVAQWRYEPPAQAPIAFPIVISFSQGQDASAVAATPNGAASGLVRTDGAIRIGGAIKTPTKIRDVRPVYPPEAMAAKVSGMVILEARINEDGAVEDAQVLRSIPILDQAAIDAVMQWRFRPTLLNGKAVPVIMTVTVNFTLQDATAQRGRTPEAAVAGQRRMPEVVKEVKPTYTDVARQAGIEGTVEMEVTVGTDGSVTDARVIRSIPLLDASALEAVRQWKFTPIPQAVAVNIEMSFRLPRRGQL